MSAWQDISTAPKDRAILVCRFGRERYPTHAVVLWDDDEAAGGPDYPWGVVSLDASQAHHKDFFTHWQPLPAPPELS